MPTTKKKAKKSKAGGNSTKSKATKKSKKAEARVKTPKAKKTEKKTAPVAKNGRAADTAKARKPAPTPKDKRQLVQERKILRSQSRWLQKALFALSKAEDDQAKLAEVRGDRHEPMAVNINGKSHAVGAVTDSLRDSVMDRLEGLRVSLRQEHSLLG